jgi:hypothetical protein
VDAGRPELHGHRLGEQDHARLRRAVGAEHGEAPLAGLARHVHDPAADAGGHHPLGARLGDEPRADEVDVEHAAELVGGDGHERPDAEADPAAAGDVGDLRDGAERRRDRRHRGLDRVGVGHVGPDRQGAAAEGLDLGDDRVEVVAGRDAVGRGLVVGAGDVEAGDVGPLGCQP